MKWQYVLALAAVGLALVARWMLDPLLRDQAAFATVLCVLMPLALLVRVAPFLAAGAVGIVAVKFFFIQPRLSFRLSGADSEAQLLLFAAATGVIGVTAWLARRARIREARVLREAAALEKQRADEVKALMDTVPVLLAIATDPTCTVVKANRATSELLGAAEGANVSKTPGEAGAGEVEHHMFREGKEIPPQDLPLQVAARTGVAPPEEELEIVTSRGEHFTVLSRCAPLLDVAGRARGAVWAGLDITKRKNAEAELAEYRQELERMVEERTRALEESQERMRQSARMAAVGKFATALGHDLANAIMPLRTHAEMLLASPALGEKDRAGVEAISRVIAYLSMLSKGLRLLALDPDHVTLRGTTDLRSWCEEACALLAAVVPKRIVVDCRMKPGLPGAVVAPHSLTQAVLNLVTNASDAITEARGERGVGRIDVTGEASSDSQEVTITVIDDGPGMTPEVLGQCRERFFTTKGAKSGGTGLGLSIVAAIVEGAGGRFEIDSALGRGTRAAMHLKAAVQGVESTPTIVVRAGADVQSGVAPVPKART